MRNALAIAFALTIFSPIAAIACQMATLPELVARQRPEPVDRNIIRELVPVPIAELAQQADLVIDADVQVVKTYLSADQCYLLTDYVVVPRALVVGAAPQSAVPGPHPIVMTLVGGVSTIDGVQVMVRDEQLPLIPSGSHVVLFLERSKRDKAKFDLVGSVSGAFAVSEDDQIKPLVRGAGPDYAMSFPADRKKFVEHVKATRAHAGK